MWPLLISLLTGSVFALTLCGNDRKDVKKKSKIEARKKSSRSEKPVHSGKKNGASASVKVQKSSNSSRGGKSNKSSKSRKSSKSSKRGSKVNKRRSQRDANKSEKASVSWKKDGSTKTAKLKAEKKKNDSGKEQKSLKLQKIQTDSSSRRDVAQIVELRADPSELTLMSTGSFQTFKFINESNERRAFKVKCSDNQLYRVNPVYGVVEPRSFATIDVLRSNGQPKVEKLVLVTTKVGPETVNPASVMASAQNESCQLTVIPLFVDA